MEAPKHSASAVTTYPAPIRTAYFTGRDYAMACLRCHEKRLTWDGVKKVRRGNVSHPKTGKHPRHTTEED